MYKVRARLPCFAFILEYGDPSCSRSLREGVREKGRFVSARVNIQVPALSSGPWKSSRELIRQQVVTTRKIFPGG